MLVGLIKHIYYHVDGTYDVVSFPQYTQCQMFVDAIHGDRKFSTVHNVKCLLTVHTVTASFPQYIENHDVSKFSTVLTVSIIFSKVH